MISSLNFSQNADTYITSTQITKQNMTSPPQGPSRSLQSLTLPFQKTQQL